jgi:hypothetical protein
MKKQKKALMGMLVAMVLSMGAMGGINKNSADTNLQQVCVGCGYMASKGGDNGGGWGACSAAAGLLAKPAWAINPIAGICAGL